ncbi:MAG: fumarylacetoacetate hydrolase family protein [Burkholderiales bacterium]|nr:fumarylacetoacetate hydrolase family protein [Burkholderiales bacterium]
MTDTYLWPPQPPAALPVRGRPERFPVRRLFFVGRNYLAHAAEMGMTVDKTKEEPFYFTKSADTLVPSGATVPFPPQTQDYHHEVELVVALGAPGFQVAAADAGALVFGYACGLDMTRRDLQLKARQTQRPWDLGKDVEGSAVVSEIVPLPGHLVDRGQISLAVNGQVRQHSDVSRLIWSVAELIADLSRYYHLQPGDLVFTGTPEGVGPVWPGDQLVGQVEGVAEVRLQVGPAA